MRCLDTHAVFISGSPLLCSRLWCSFVHVVGHQCTSGSAWSRQCTCLRKNSRKLVVLVSGGFMLLELLLQFTLIFTLLDLRTLAVQLFFFALGNKQQPVHLCVCVFVCVHVSQATELAPNRTCASVAVIFALPSRLRAEISSDLGQNSSLCPSSCCGLLVTPSQFVSVGTSRRKI